VTISVLAIAEYSDLPETWQLIGLHKAGVDLHVICSDTARHKQLLLDAGIKVTWLKFSSRFDSKARATIRAVLNQGEFDIVHVFTNKSLQNTLPFGKKHP
jgi:hypothetical protein